MRDARTILLLLLSFCLAATWVYHIYDKSKYAAVPLDKVELTAADATKQFNDSLNNLYRVTIAQLETVITGKDSLNRELQQRASEIDTLKTEIVNMLNEQTITKEDLRRALLKIQDLQVKIYQYNNQSTAFKNNAPQTTSTAATQTAAVKNSKSKIPETAEASFLIQDVAAQSVTSNGASQVAVSFLLKAMAESGGNAAVYLVLKDPGGTTVQDDEWIAGVFTSKTEGSLRYSKKLNWDFNRNDSHRFSTSIPVTRFTKGAYQLLLYCNGQKIGKTDIVVAE